MNCPFEQARAGNYRPGRTQPVEYIVVHYTGNWSDTAKNNADYFARTVTGTSAHYFVDEEAVWQSVREEDTAWHCGSSQPVHPACRNANSIGVEMCNSAGGVPPAVRDRTAALVRELMARYGVPAEHVLRHYDVTGKRCPAPWVDRPGEWEDFKGRLEVEEVTQEQFDAMLEDYLVRRGEREASGWAAPYIQNAVAAGVMAEEAGGIGRPQAFATREELIGTRPDVEGIVRVAHDVGALVVCDGDQLAGIVSERDVVRRLQEDETVLDREVSSIMTSDVKTCAPDQRVTDLMQVMTTGRFRHMPVLEDGRLVGIVSIGDVVKHRMNELEFERDQLDSYVHTSQT